MPPAGFEPAFPASERPQTHALDRHRDRQKAEKGATYLCRYSFMFGLAQGPTDVPIIFFGGGGQGRVITMATRNRNYEFREKLNRVLFGWII